MNTTEPFPVDRSDKSGLTDSTHSSSSSASERYQLDDADARPILLYKYRGGLQTSSQKDLCAWLDKDERHRVTRKHIPRGTSHVEVWRHDLYLPEEKDMYAKTANYFSSLACVRVPSLAYWTRLFMGSYDELFIVSPESTPTSSIADGDSESRRTSPTQTWDYGSQEDARSGASDDNPTAS